jgi:hypothetical protein
LTRFALTAAPAYRSCSVLYSDADKSDASAAAQTPAGAEAFAAAIAAIASRQDPQVARDTSVFLKKQARLLDLQAQHPSSSPPPG